MCLFAIILQQPVETLMSKLKGKQKHLVLNLFHLLSSFGSVATWRGIWTIFPRYIFHGKLKSFIFFTFLVEFFIPL